MFLNTFSTLKCIKRLINYSKNFNTSAIVKPQKVSKIRTVHNTVKIPTYVKSYARYLNEIEPLFNKPKTNEDINRHRESCHLAKQILDELGKLVKPGITTDYIDSVAHKLCMESNAYPSPLLYRKFPKSICTSVNNVACHGIPDNRPLEDGDIINIDVTVYKNDYHGDISHTYPVGSKVDSNGLKLIRVAQFCRDEAIKICKPGQKFNAIGKIISEIARLEQMTVVPDICGHGIGAYFHGPPEIVHTENENEGTMEEGMTFTIEPVISEGDSYIELLNDGWTIITCDNSRTAQFEHTILITKKGFEVLTN